MKPNRYAVFLAVGFELLGLVGACVWLGSWLDERFQTGGLILVGLVALGLAAWLLHIVVLVRGFEKSDDSSS